MREAIPTSGSPMRAAVAYVVLTGAFSSVFYAVTIISGHISGGAGAYVSGLMWCPALAALATARWLGSPLAGWRWPTSRWLWIGYLLPIGYAGLAYAAVWTSGAGTFPAPAFVQATRDALGLPLRSDGAVVLTAWLIYGTTGMVQGTARALGEEIGWRGYLTPRLVERFGFLPGSLMVGVVWAAWHIPILVFANYQSASPLWIAVPSFSVMILALSVTLSWLRLRSGSLWPCALLHASHNLFIQRLLTPATGRTGAWTDWSIDEFGIALPIATTLVALVILARGRSVRVTDGC